MSATKTMPSAYAGVYTLPDAARVLGLRASKLGGWLRAGDEDTAAGRLSSKGEKRDRHFDFHTLIELYVVAFLRKEGVSMPTIRRARDELAKRFKTDHPFALRDVMTDGKTVIKALEEGTLLELGTGGQTAFEKVLDPLCQKLDFDQTTKLANAYYPDGRESAVVVDPKRAFGKPIIVGTATPTETIASLIRGGDSAEQVAEDFRLTLKQVEDAWRFEKRAA